MIANYGYKDGSGEYFITIDTDKCNGCGECVRVCPAQVLATTEDPNDPFRELPVAIVVEEHRKKIKYSCAPCKPTGECEIAGRKLETKPPCVQVCEPGALTHSW
jgi:ferredoxin